MPSHSIIEYKPLISRNMINHSKQINTVSISISFDKIDIFMLLSNYERHTTGAEIATEDFKISMVGIAFVNNFPQNIN